MNAQSIPDDMKPLNPGRPGLLDILAPGPGNKVIGQVEAIVLNGTEYIDGEIDVILLPMSEDERARVRELLARVDIDLDDLSEGPVRVMRNMNAEWFHAMRYTR